MLRKLKSLTSSNKTKTPDIKHVATLLTAKEREILTNKITNFCEKISDGRITIYPSATNQSATLTAKQYTQMRLEYSLGLKTLSDCKKTYGLFAECLLDDTITADNTWSMYTYHLYKHLMYMPTAVDPMKLHNGIADAFIQLYKKHLDTPSTLALITRHSYEVIPRIKPVLNAFQKTRGANEQDFLFCCELACNLQINFLKEEHVKVILQKLADLREHKADTALHRNFILQILKNTKDKWDFYYLEISDLYALIQHIEALPVNKENALTQLGTHFYDVYWYHLDSLQENGFNEEADIRFTLSQLLRGTIQSDHNDYSIGTALRILRAAGLDTPQNRENLFAKNESDRSDINSIVNSFEPIQLHHSPLRQAVFQHILDKPKNRWALITILEKLHKHKLLSDNNIKKILSKSDFISVIEKKLTLLSLQYTTITQDLFDQLITTDQDRDIAFLMSAHGRLGATSPAKTITTHGPISDPKYLPGFLSTFYSKPQQKAPHPENSHAADDETPTLR